MFSLVRGMGCVICCHHLFEYDIGIILENATPGEMRWHCLTIAAASCLLKEPRAKCTEAVDSCGSQQSSLHVAKLKGPFAYLELCNNTLCASYLS